MGILDTAPNGVLLLTSACAARSATRSLAQVLCVATRWHWALLGFGVLARQQRTVTIDTVLQFDRKVACNGPIISSAFRSRSKPLMSTAAQLS